MFGKVVVPNNANELELPAGSQFCLYPLTGGRFPVKVKPNGLDGEAFDYADERVLALGQFNKLVVPVPAGSKWMAYVAASGEAIGRAARKPVELFRMEKKGPEQIEVTGGGQFDLPSLTSLSAGPATIWDLSRFSRIHFIARCQGVTSAQGGDQPALRFFVDLHQTEEGFTDTSLAEFQMGQVNNYGTAGIGELVVGQGMATLRNDNEQRESRQPLYGAFRMVAETDAVTTHIQFNAGRTLISAWGFYD